MLFRSSAHERKWRFGQWSKESVEKIKDLLESWALWILKGEMGAHNGPNSLIAKLDYITTEE